ncbi:MAG TPA: ribbon-helix-helix protein, CopG family [Polyangiaceae bacterium]|nr:ribbon-helix-helix protein, CopG family [Polyangiaceae bacterium]
MSTMVERTKQLTIRIAEEEIEMLRDLAEREGLTGSDILRQFIRRRHAELFGVPKRRRKKR